MDPKAEAEMEREIMKGSSPLAVYLLPFLPKAKLSYAEYETKETEGVDRGMVERLKARGVKRLTFHFDILDVVVNDPTLLKTAPRLSERRLKGLSKELAAFKEDWRP